MAIPSGGVAAEVARQHPVRLVLDRCYFSMHQMARDFTLQENGNKSIAFIAKLLTYYTASFDVTVKLKKVSQKVFIAQCSEDVEQFAADFAPS